MRLSQEQEHVEPQKRHVLEDGDDYAHGVQADEALDADVMTQVLAAAFYSTHRVMAVGSKTKQKKR